jgi:hypothetical protein
MLRKSEPVFLWSCLVHALTGKTIASTVFLNSMVSSMPTDGCQIILAARHGKEKGNPINKPRRIATLRSTLPQYLNELCAGGHSQPHTIDGGAATKETQCYTRLIVNMLYKSIVRDSTLLLPQGEGNSADHEQARCMPTESDLLCARDSRPTSDVGSTTIANMAVPGPPDRESSTA